MGRADASFTFIHCADLHLDSPFKGLGSARPELADRLRRANLRCVDDMVDLALEEGALAIVFAGDVFDSRVRSLASRIRFREALRRAGQHGIQCFIAHGNHDHTGTDMGVPLELGNVHVFGTEAESALLRKDGKTVAEVVGISHDGPAVRENLALRLEGDPEMFTIGLLHCNVGSASGQEPYAPCLSSDLQGRNVDYWALGHVHKRQVLMKDPYVVYPGNSVGRDINEDGEKGAYVVRVRGGFVSELTFRPFQDVVWRKEGIDISGMTHEDEILEAIRSTRRKGFTLMHLTLTGSGPLDPALRDPQLLEELRYQLCNESLEVTSIDVRTRPEIDLLSRRQGQDLLASVLRMTDEIRLMDDTSLRALITSREGSHRIRQWVDELDHEDLEKMLDDVEAWCADRLTEEGQ